MLEYEDELELSDRIVARRSVEDQLSESGKKPTEAEQQIIERGDEAAKTLVEHYLPKIGKIASQILKRSTNANHSDITHEELVQEGTMAAMRVCRSFNARGKVEGRPGRRFGTYAHMAISKAMNRYIAKQSTPMRVDIDVIQASWVWLSAKEELQAELGREPTDDELEERTDISADYVEPGIPHRASIRDVDDPDMFEIGDPRRQAIIMKNEYESSVERITQVLEQAFNEQTVYEISMYMGFDRMYPRSYDDLADALNISKRRAKELIGEIESCMVHPKFRVALRDAIKELGDQLVDHSAQN